jgi:hypothetical protein
MRLLDQRPLRAGPLSLVLEGGEPRYVRCHGTEVLRRVYGAVRDASWNTLPGDLSDLTIVEGDGRFAVSCSSTHRRDDVDFHWRASIEGASPSPDVALLTMAFDGEARSAFATNRIGLCVLLPPDTWRGRTVHVTTVHGTELDAVVPVHVAVEQPVASWHDLRSLGATLPPGLDVRLAFEGEVFEMEDQRNWIDASFKIYGTPLSRPRPVTIHAGARVRQRVTLEVKVRHGSRTVATRQTGPTTRLRVTPHAGSGPPIPPTLGIGLGQVESRDADVRTAFVLRALRPDHVRLVFGPDARQARATLGRYARALARAATLVPLELVLDIPGGASDQRELCQAIRDAWPAGVNCARVLSLTAGLPTTTGAALTAAQTLVSDAGWVGSPVLTGSRQDLYELHLTPPPAGGGLFWGMNPQVHACDATSLSETPAAAAAQAEAMAARHPSIMRVVSPITLERRGQPSPTLRRHPLSAAWLCAVLSHLLTADLASMTVGDAIDHLCDEDGALTPVGRVLAAVRPRVSQTSPDGGGTTRPDEWRVEWVETGDEWLTAIRLTGHQRTLWLANPSPHRSYRVDISEPWPAWRDLVEVAPCAVVQVDETGLTRW